MKSSKFLIVFIIHFGQLMAQNGFYIKPSVNFLKFYKNDDYGYVFNSKAGTQIEVNPRNFYSAFPDILLGFNAGYKTKNFFYECGIFQDGTSNYVQLKYITYDVTTSSYYSGSYTSYSGIAQRSFPFRMGMKLCQIKSKLYERMTYSLYLTGGVEIQCNYGRSVPHISQTGFTPDGVNDITITIQTNKGVRRVYHPSIGVLFEIKNDRDFNLFNLNINYNLSFFQAGWLQSRSVVIEDIDHKKYSVGSYTSKGTGLYIGISKSIYFNRIFKRKNRISSAQS